MRDELIKKLMRVYLLAWASCGVDRQISNVSDHERVEAGLCAVLDELAKAGVGDALPIGTDMLRELGVFQKWEPESNAVLAHIRIHVAPIIAAQCARIAELESFMAADQPWPTIGAVARLIEGADHLLNDHDCDQDGYESLIAARDAMRERLGKCRT